MPIPMSNTIDKQGAPRIFSFYIQNVIIKTNRNS